ncbi:ABC transporter substrate-binding protein [Pseudonocardia petroleophila]|uniref:Amino acid ABC transporter substrate-binding protein n=1 Tax=Pseudonocardia petroleophila TaxID=37331 RepID=A0A7G7MCH4_9PSEU|nr:ABC transporter substrate-binding protein [Pseudonocardia petroleophila]QNG50485.1 amino acid ABC transporter substrate-binding protein [Pseudonocardia petroleophila]
MAVLAALLLVAACGGGAGGASAGGSAEPLVIAFPVPLTSGNKAASDEMVNTAQLAVKSINESGGAGGRQLELRVYDDRLTADESARIAQRALTQDGAEVIMGGYTSIEGLAIREVTERRNVVYMATSTISPQLVQDATYTFRVAHDQGDYPVQMAELYAQLGFRTPVVVHDDGPTGSTLFGPIGDALRANGLQPAEPVAFSLNSTDMSSAVAAVKATGPDSIVYIGSSGADAGLMLKTLAEQGVNLPVLGFGSLISAEALSIGGTAYDQTSVYTLANIQPSKPQWQEFVDLYAAEYGGDPEQLRTGLVEQTAQTWDAFELLRQALDATGGDTEGDALVAALKSVPPFEGAAGRAGGFVSLVDSQTAYRQSLVAFELEGGKPVEAAVPAG